jgi:acyl-CoA thioester hydrolase
MISAEIAVVAQFYDLDPMKVVWHGNYARYLEQARCALLEKLGYSYQEMEQSGYVWPIVDLRVK